MARKNKKRKNQSAVQSVEEPPEKQLKKEEEVPSVCSENDSDVICLDTDAEPSSSENGPNDSSHEEYPDPRWLHENGIPEDYEKRVLGVEFCGARQHLDLALKARKRYLKECEKLDKSIWMHYKHNGQNAKVYDWKMEVRDKLFKEFQGLFHEYEDMALWAVGSTVNGCGSFNSDMDLCLCLPTPTGENQFQYPTDKSKCIRALRQICNCLRKKPVMRQLVRHCEVISGAKVPIIKVDLHPPFEELDLDINVNNIAGVYNSHLIHYYAKVDVRFPAICLLVKHWAIRNEISDAMTGTFNSYSLILLVLHYLQCGVKPAILPNLQFLFPDLFSLQKPLHSLELHRDLVGLPEVPQNKMKIGDLVMGFFSYYHHFDFNTYAISIKSGRKFPRSEIPLALVPKKYKIFIEEPFDLINTARCVQKDHNFHAIKKAFKNAHFAFVDHPPHLSNIGIQM